jgi:hypothetical protein
MCGLLTVTLAVPASAAGVADAVDEEGSGGAIDREGGAGPARSIAGGPNAHKVGAWAPVQRWPLVAIHSIILPNGKVMTYGTNQNGRPSYGFNYDVWDPVTGNHTTLPVTTATNLFCSAQTVLPWSGQVLITGGDENGLPGGGFNDAVNDVNVFDPADNSLRRLSNSMAKTRWYPTTTTLPNGEVLVHGGRDDQPRMRPALVPEVYGPDTGWRRLSAAASADVYGSGRWWYPRSWVAPNGKIFIVTKGDRGLWMLDTEGRGSMKRVGTYPKPSTNNTTSAAMFDEGRILITRAEGRAAVIDITGKTPKVSETGSLRSYRAWSDATVLADGEVLVTGGASRYQQLKHATNHAEIWNPGTGRWRTGASARKARLYHSSAILLPDATVLTAGGGPPGPVTNLNAEIYHPPYLFADDGSGRPAPRPRIAGVGDVDWGRSFDVGIAGGERISKVSLVRTGSVTHSFDMDQRFLDLDYVQSGDRLTVKAPRNSNVAPPGQYMLFVFDGHGVPSVAEIVQLNNTSAPGSQAVQAGSLTLAQSRAGRWIDVAFQRPFDREPVVAVGAPSANAADPVMARVRNITAEGFQLRLDEWSNLDGRHGEETVSFIAAEPGRHNVGGVMLEAGAVTADGTWRQAAFGERFATTPVVLPQLSSDADGTAANVRLDGVNAKGFQLRLQEHEARERKGVRHGQETVGYIALTGGRGEIAGRPIKVGATRVNVDDRWRPLRFGVRFGAPDLVAAGQTARGAEPVTLRYSALGPGSARVRMQEERSHDRETRHAAERVGWVVIGKR